MAKFNVIVTRDCTESTTVDVEAATEAEAREKALEEVEQFPGDFEWVADECSGNQSDPYATGCEEEGADLREAAEGDECTACGRGSFACSLSPCAQVLADREG